jgi:hypothetical protein
MASGNVQNIPMTGTYIEKSMSLTRGFSAQKPVRTASSEVERAVRHQLHTKFGTPSNIQLDIKGSSPSIGMSSLSLSISISKNPQH